MELPFGNINSHSASVLREVISMDCDMAGVPVFALKQLRHRVISQWARADEVAGARNHGKTLGVLDHYVCHEDVLV